MTLPTDSPQFLFDDAWIASSSGVTRRWMPADLHPEPVLRPDRPWEGRMLGLFGTTMAAPFEGAPYRMYYTNFEPEARRRTSNVEPAVFLAVSDDAMTWHKPGLDAVPLEGAAANNMVHRPGHHLDSPSVFHDPDDAPAPFKLLAFEAQHRTDIWNRTWGLYTYTSRDGVRWNPTRTDGERNIKAGDRTSVWPQRLDGRYAASTRSHAITRRAVSLSTSEDFTNWTEPELILDTDLVDEPDVEYYGMPVFQRHGWFIGLLEVWRSGTDVMEVHLALSRDGVHWLRPQPREPFLAPAFDWNRAWNTCASNGPLVIGDQMVFHFGGRDLAHGFAAVTGLGAIGCATLGTDRFCAVEAETGGSLETPPFAWPGGELALNADTRRRATSHPMALDGSIRVEVLDEQGEPIGGYEDATFIANTHCRGEVHDDVVRWTNGNALTSLAGCTIRLRFTLRDARLYTFEARRRQPL